MCDSNRFGIQSEYRLGLSDLGSSDWKAKIEAVTPERQPLNSRIFGLPVWEEYGEKTERNLVRRQTLPPISGASRPEAVKKLIL